MSLDAVALRDQTEVDRLVERLNDPRTAAALNTLLDNVELLAVMVQGVDGLARKGEIVGDTIADVLGEVRAAGKATGLDPKTTSKQLATLIPTLAEASPAINRILASPILEPEPIAVLSEAAEALVKGVQAAQSNETKVGVKGLWKATHDEDVQRGLGFLIEVARAFGSDLKAKTFTS